MVRTRRGVSVDEFGVSSFSRRQDEIERFLEYQNCPTRLRRSIFEHVRMMWTQNNVVDTDSLIERLPSGLKERIAIELHGSVLLDVSFMTFWTDSLKCRFANHLRVVYVVFERGVREYHLLMLSRKCQLYHSFISQENHSNSNAQIQTRMLRKTRTPTLEHRYFCAKDPICGRMEKNSNLYIVASGKVNFELHMSQGRRRSVHRETFTLTRGDFFGESAVVSILENRFNRGFCEHIASSITSCKLLYIDAETMRTLILVVVRA